MAVYKLPGVEGACFEITLGMKTEKLVVYAHLYLICDEQGILSPIFRNGNVSVFGPYLEYCWGTAVWNNSYRKMTRAFNGAGFEEAISAAWEGIELASKALQHAVKDVVFYEKRFEQAMTELVSMHKLELL